MTPEDMLQKMDQSTSGNARMTLSQRKVSLSSLQIALLHVKLKAVENERDYFLSESRK
jgi:hypothetical protein